MPQCLCSALRIKRWIEDKWLLGQGQESRPPLPEKTAAKERGALGSPPTAVDYLLITLL